MALSGIVLLCEADRKQSDRGLAMLLWKKAQRLWKRRKKHHAASKSYVKKVVLGLHD
jgi:hypothetical protein